LEKNNTGIPVIDAGILREGGPGRRRGQNEPARQRGVVWVAGRARNICPQVSVTSPNLAQLPASTGPLNNQRSRPTATAIQGGPVKVRPTLLVTFECVGKIK